MNSVSTVELNGFHVSLVPFGDQHITEAYVGWLNDQEMSKIILSAETTTTLEECRAYAESLILSNENHFFAMIANDTKEHIGNFRLGPHDKHNDRIQLGMMIGNKSYWGRGIGSEVVSLGLNFAFEILNVHKVFLDVREDNLGAIRIYEKNNFFHEGVLKEHVKKNNRFYDLVLMSAINPGLN